MDIDGLERKLEQERKAKEHRKRKRMKVSGKSVFALQRFMEKNIGKTIIKKRRKK